MLKKLWTRLPIIVIGTAFLFVIACAHQAVEPDAVETQTPVTETTVETEPEAPAEPQASDQPEPDADEWHALPCDSPIIIYALLLMGIDDEKIKKSVDRLKEEWMTEQGWFCHFFS